jgi:hypothetical protein
MPNNFLMLTGRLAAKVREFFVRFLAASESLERMRPGMFCWLGAPNPHVRKQSENASLAA